MEAGKRTKKEIEEIIIFVRLHLYNYDLPCGANAIRDKMYEMFVKNIPSISTIGRILKKASLTNKRTGYYKSED